MPEPTTDYQEITVTTTASDAGNKVDFHPGTETVNCIVVNDDATNFIRVGFDPSRNANSDDIKVAAGEIFRPPFKVEGLCMVADTASVNVRVWGF